ncbi:histidine phosphatase family protein [Isoptericola sp. BMS4]|uniref:histidine phosphatase family protein n=1 Tax=Isoptericola sp. BMS4 TaxID=2527875 RepID=UPI0014209102|nr:histidine phosphatase family protein [Isoptericola sp. BMS4]
MIRPSGASPLADSTARTVVLVRHGVTALTEVRAYSGGGVPGPSLTGRGRTQAARAADAVFRIGKDLWPDLPRAGALVASPMLRTLETAAAVGRRTGRHPRTDERFAECDFGAWEGLTPEQVAEAWPAELEAWRSAGVAPPGGESLAQVGERAWAGLRDVVGAGEPSATTVVATHTITIRALVGRALGAPPSSWPVLRLPPCSLTVLRFGLADDGVPTLAEITATGFPTDV